MKSYVFKLLQLLDSHSYISSQELAVKVRKSTKTVHKQIEQLNTLLAGKAYIEAKVGKGYRLIKKDDNAFRAFCAAVVTESNDVLQRREYILTTLFVEECIKINTLAQTLFVNEKTISNDLKVIRELLQPFQLTLKTKPHYGLVLMGSEENKRFFILRHKLNIVYQLTDDERALLNTYLLSFCFSPIAMYNIEMMISISFARIKLGYCIVNYDETIQRDQTFIDFIAQCQINSIPHQECAFLIQYIQQLKHEQKTTLNELTIKRGLYLIEETFGLQLIENESFCTKMKHHLEALQKRIAANIYITNPLVTDILKNLTLEYNIARYFGSWLYEQFQMHLTEDELGFLAIIFALVTTPLKITRKNILMVSNLNANSYQLLETTYYHLFGEYVEKIDSCSLQQLKTIDFSHYDHVIVINGHQNETVLTHEKVQNVPYFLTASDEKAIKKLFSNTKKIGFEQLLNEQLFFIENERILDKEAFLKSVCHKISDITQQPVSQSILKRYRLGATQMGNKAVFLHPIGTMRQACRPFIATIVLKHPVFWEFSSVHLVFIVSLPPINHKNSHIYDSLSTFMLDDALMNAYQSNMTFQQLQTILYQLEEEKKNG